VLIAAPTSLASYTTPALPSRIANQRGSDERNRPFVGIAIYPYPEERSF
jgi:hypothetical protein